VKSGDDCRQEHLAVQLISHFYGRCPFVYILFHVLCSSLSCSMVPSCPASHFRMFYTVKNVFQAAV
jgi:hypothetical protein